MRETVGRPHLVEWIERYAAVVIAAHRERVQPFEALHRFGGPERPRDTVAEVDDAVCAAAKRKVVQHGVERGYVSVDVGKNG